MHLNTRNVNTAFRTLVEYFANLSDYGVTYTPYGKMVSIRKDSRNGPVLMIDGPVTITYSQPKERVLFNQARDANPFFHLYESLWMLAGRNDVAPLAYYASNMTNYSDDGKTLNGAYGYRWRYATTTESDGRSVGVSRNTDQLDTIVQHLKTDPTSRRAVLAMWNVEDDLLKIGESKDVCCNLNVMFSLREIPWEYPNEKARKHSEEVTGCVPRHVLDMTVTNRSNDMIWGMLGANYVHFTFLQEYMAARLGVEVGRYHHFTNNLHVYESNWKPQEWLDRSNYSQGQDYQEQDKQLKTIPLVRCPKTFERELFQLVETYSGDDPNRRTYSYFEEPFFENVASPMFQAFSLYRRNRDFDTALGICKHLKADDWRIAACNWLLKRRK